MTEAVPTAPAPAPIAAPSGRARPDGVRVVLERRRGGGATGRLRLRCAAADCRGNVELRLPARNGRGERSLGRAAYRVRAGRTANVRLTLGPADRRALRAAGATRVRVVIRAAGRAAERRWMRVGWVWAR